MPSPKNVGLSERDQRDRSYRRDQIRVIEYHSERPEYELVSPAEWTL